jgi:hypothetical protein
MPVATLDGPTMFARIGMMRALNRHVERVLIAHAKIIIGEDTNWRGIVNEFRACIKLTRLAARQFRKRAAGHRSQSF